MDIIFGDVVFVSSGMDIIFGEFVTLGTVFVTLGTIFDTVFITLGTVFVTLCAIFVAVLSTGVPSGTEIISRCSLMCDLVNDSINPYMRTMIMTIINMSVIFICCRGMYVNRAYRTTPYEILRNDSKRIELELKLKGMLYIIYDILLFIFILEND
jgi:hypothetical protein